MGGESIASHMNRRRYLTAVGAAGTAATAGCLTGLFDSGSAGPTTLPAPDDQLADSEDLAYPAYGQEFPAFELPAIPGDNTMNTGKLDRITVSTAFFSSCPAECSILLNHLAGVQGQLADRELDEDPYILPVTFDPQRDDADRLREHATIVGADLDAGNWHYLRPQDKSEAERIVADKLGISYDRVADSQRLEGYDFTHSVVTWLVNPGGIVERAYRGENLDRTRVIDDIEQLDSEYEPQNG
jgi:protein SCO1/2